MSELPVRAFRSIFLVTYSRANPHIVPNKEQFARIVTEAVERATPSTVIQWVVGEEKHSDGGIHFHMAMKVDRQQRWLCIRDRIRMDHGINVNFSDGHPNYYTAWTYVTKEDPQPLQSENHPDLKNATLPRTTAASHARLETGEPSSKVAKVPRLNNLDVSLIISEKGIKTYLQLMALAKSQKDEGKYDLLQYVVNKGTTTN